MSKLRKIVIGEFTFDCHVTGDEQNDLVIFLHGFPETSIMWIKLMKKITSLGFFCIAPTMRGYSKDACPVGVKNYAVKHLRQDIIDLTDNFGKQKFHLVGHDWGAAIGWNLVYNHPDRIISWSALSVPHNRSFAKAVRLDKEQKKKSRYIAWFLLPFLPEWYLRRNDFQLFRRLWKHCSVEELSNYLSVFRRKKSLTAALNYYRANIGKRKNERIGDISSPTLFIWGNRDLAVGRTAAEGCEKYIAADFKYKEVAGGHWLIQSSYSEVESAIIEHIKSNQQKHSLAN